MTQITGPGGPQVMTGGENEEHPEPEVLGSVLNYRVIRGVEGDTVKPAVIYDGPSKQFATEAFDETDPGDGYVQMIEDGEVVEAKRKQTLATVEAAGAPEVGRQASAFDVAPFTGGRPMIDDEEADKIRVMFTGSWELDPMLEADVKFFNELALGKSVDLRVEVEVADKTARYKRAPETDEETITGIAKVKVVHAHRLTAEEL